MKGNINSPEFSYKKIIFKTLTNLLVKVAVSPIQFLAGSLGLSSDKLENLPFEATQNDFTPEQLTKINLLAEMLKSKTRNDSGNGAIRKPPAKQGHPIPILC